MWNLLISLLLAIISYCTTKKGNSKNEGKAIAAAAAAGLGSYYLLSETEWGQESVEWLNKNVAYLDGAKTPVATTTDASGKVIIAPGTPATGGSTSGLWSTLSSWGPAGTAAVIGTARVATGRLDSKWIWAVGGIALLLLMK